MQIDKIRIQNFKRFEDATFEFNPDVNIIVGSNDSGKSTILEAIEICLNSAYRGKAFVTELKADLFNRNALQKYLDSDQTIEDLPKISIELFINGVPEYKGNNNSLSEDSQGLKLSVLVDRDLAGAYEEYRKAQESIKSIPIEFYKIEWFTFSWDPIKYMTRKVSGLFIDTTRLHPTYGKNRYITNILNATLSKENLALLNVNYRQLKELFSEQQHVVDVNAGLDSDDVVTDRNLEIVADVAPSSSFETGLQLAVDAVNFPLIGKGEQNKIQIKLAMQNAANNINLLLIEEPENHLSHANLTALIGFIEDQRGDKQLFITTHSSYVLNKLSINKLCLIGNEYTRLKDLNSDVTKRLKRLPSYDTMRAVLADKMVLVEGPSDELVLKKFYFERHNKLPEEDGIDLIVVRGLGFANYLEIARALGKTVTVVKDNDHNYTANIVEYAADYTDFGNIKFLASDNDDYHSLEPLLIGTNSQTDAMLEHYAEIVLSPQTFTLFKNEAVGQARIDFLRTWFKDKGNTGSKKVDSAMKIFESDKSIVYPEFFSRVFEFA